jgi:hypothetical protein
MVDVLLTSKQLDEARVLAIETYEKFKNFPGYYNNKPDSHLKGKLGELAVEQALKNVGIDCDSAFRDVNRDRECDILIEGRRLEVKTWSDAYWLQMGRCIAVGQLPRLKKKADFVVWCSTPYVDGDVAQVRIYGVTPINQIECEPRRLTGPDWGRKVDNFQVNFESISSFETFIEAL